MRQIILILSFVIAAFVAACAQSDQRTPTGKGSGSQKTVEQLDKLSSDTELEKMKKQLESNSAVQAPDVIAVIKRVFGNAAKKEQPKSNKKDKKKQEKLVEKDLIEDLDDNLDDEKIKRQPPSDFDVIMLMLPGDTVLPKVLTEK